MATVLGQPARYVTDQVRIKRKRWLIAGIMAVALGAAATGFIWSKLLLKDHSIRASIMLACFVVPTLLTAVWCVRRGDELEVERLNMQRGADGENSVSRELNRLVDHGFAVLHDIDTGFGNLDHVVVGASGIFMIETKNWRGVVSSDSKGELLLNGRPTTKPEIRRFLHRIMGVREKVKALLPDTDPYYQAVFVFVGTRVEAKWGTTRSAHCIRDDQLFDYIVNLKSSTRLSKQQVERLGRAFEQLAVNDLYFSRTA